MRAGAVRKARSYLVLSLGIASLLGCGSPAGPPPPSSNARVLVFGNSLSSVNNLPGLIQAVAAEAGFELPALGVMANNFSLEEHWAAGAADVIRDVSPDFVLLQQGPSSLNESRAHLIQWTETFAPVIREVGAEPALLMVWPETARLNVFDAVRDNYLAAADAVQGRFIPAGEAWRALMAEPAAPSPYGPDGFHPSQVGSLLSAFVVVRVLTGQDLAGMPTTYQPPGGPVVEVSGDLVRVLERLANETVAAWPQ